LSELSGSSRAHRDPLWMLRRRRSARVEIMIFISPTLRSLAQLNGGMASL
jgi:hypothetical protein